MLKKLSLLVLIIFFLKSLSISCTEIPVGKKNHFKEKIVIYCTKENFKKIACAAGCFGLVITIIKKAHLYDWIRCKYYYQVLKNKSVITLQ